LSHSTFFCSECEVSNELGLHRVCFKTTMNAPLALLKYIKVVKKISQYHKNDFEKYATIIN
jgi:hypothetical protein